MIVCLHPLFTCPFVHYTLSHYIYSHRNRELNTIINLLIKLYISRSDRCALSKANYFCIYLKKSINRYSMPRMAGSFEMVHKDTAEVSVGNSGFSLGGGGSLIYLTILKKG